MRNLHEINRIDIPEDVKWAALWFRGDPNLRHYQLKWSPTLQIFSYKEDGFWYDNHLKENSLRSFANSGRSNNYDINTFNISMIEIV